MTARDAPDDHAIDERWTRAGTCDIFARVTSIPPARPHPTVVLVHGLAVSSQLLLPTMAQLAPAFRTYAPDLPGNGRSPKADIPSTIAAMADVLVDWLDALGLDRPVLAGHSAGAQVIAEVDHRHPGRIGAAVLVAPTGDPRSHNMLIQVSRLTRDALREPPRLSLLVVQDYLRVGPRRNLAMIRSMNAHPMIDRVANLTVPAVLVTGDRDAIVPARWRTTIARRLPGSRITLILAGAHGIQYTHADALAEAIREFVEEHLGD
jgi:2-hydroxy-6-oxonona-2,4-dienedioate hydrolase